MGATVRVLYFAQASRLTGIEREDISLDSSVSTLRDLSRVLMGRYPALGDLASALQWAIDEEIAPMERRLEAGMTIAVLPPFSGG